MSRAFIPGFRIKEGRLLIFTEAEVLVLPLWPDLEAVRKRSRASRWVTFTPVFRLLRPPSDGGPRPGSPCGQGLLGPSGVVPRALNPELERHRGFAAFRQALPSEVAKAVEKFPSRQWRLLQVIKRNARALDLFGQNPALAFCMSHPDGLRPACLDGVGVAAQLAQKKQRDILGWLGFPGTDACARIMAKIDPRAVHLQSAEELRDALGSQGVEKLLAHLPRINTGVLALVGNPRLLACVTPKLLAEVAMIREEDERGAVAPLLNDLRMMQVVVEPEERPRVFGSVAKLRQTHREATVAYYQRKAEAIHNFRFPSPPVPGTDQIIPLVNGGELIEEGRQQCNCVAKWVESGGGYLYRVLQPERATLAIARGPDGSWEIQQLLLAENRPVAAGTEESIAAWLKKYAFSV